MLFWITFTLVSLSGYFTTLLGFIVTFVVAKTEAGIIVGLTLCLLSALSVMGVLTYLLIPW